LLRQAKSSRQIILATHNANLPVNADAEFVFALESVNGRGRIFAQGGLDRREMAFSTTSLRGGAILIGREYSQRIGALVHWRINGAFAC
jgi:hypothetical protein